MSLIVRDARTPDGHAVDAVVGDHGRIASLPPAGTATARPADTVVDAHGAALLPGLADRHVHLMALAAALDSVPCGPPAVHDPATLGTALRAAPAGRDGWVRGTGYHESVAGPLDRDVLDRLEPARPVRVQHRGGALWSLNGAAARRTGLDDPGADLPAGVERDRDGTPTGRLWRLDAWLRERLGPPVAPGLARVGTLLAAHGVTAVHDATPALDAAALAAFAEAVAGRELPQHVTLLGAPTWPRSACGGRLVAGPAKILPPDHDPLPYDELLAAVRAARARTHRPVAVHCVTLEGLVTALTALQEAGPVPGDRIEHAAVVPPALLPLMRATGVAVVTQPAFVAERGDAYRADVDPADVPHLYPYASLLAAGIRVSPSSDAPYGTADLWAAVRAARDRRTPGGHVLGDGERVPADIALRALFHRPALRAGDVADLCLLHVPWRDAVADPDTAHVRMTVCNGRIVTGG